MRKRKLLIISHVLPFPGFSGQQRRVFYTAKAAREFFHTTFTTFVKPGDERRVGEGLLALCDDAILLPSQYHQSLATRARFKTLAMLHSARTGLKASNYIIGQVEFSPSRVSSLLRLKTFDCVLFEYWHAARSAPVFRERGIPCVLDMHDVLWQDYKGYLKSRLGLPKWWKRRALNKYKAAEEEAWGGFDALVAINREEARYVQERIPRGTRLFYAPMGTDLSLWAYSWNPVCPMRLAYYSGLANPANQENALKCYYKIMPEIWRRFPDAELWLVGSNPPPSITSLSADARVKVTGYVEDVRPILSTMSVVLCPWSGTYGFRSRLIEVMALGVPVAASPDAVYGMELEEGKGVLLGEGENGLASVALRLLTDRAFADEQSQFAREQVERLFSMRDTYGRLAAQLADWLDTRANGGSEKTYAGPAVQI